MDADLDYVLIERFQKGDKSAFDELLERYYRPVLSLIYRFTGMSGSEAQDAAQEIFLRVYTALPRFEERAKFFTYLYKVTMNFCLKERFKNARRQKHNISLEGDWENPDAINISAPDPSGSALDHLEREEFVQVVYNAVMELPEDQRAAVVLYRYKHLSYEEIGDVLGISLAAVKSRLHRAKLGLQKKLSKYLT